MIEAEIDKSDPEGNGLATSGKIVICNKKTPTPFKSTSIAKTNTTEYDILQTENIDTPREYFALIHNKEHAYNLFGNKKDSIIIRTEFHENINRTFEKISTQKAFNFVYLYFKEPLPQITNTIAENMFDVLDSPNNHLLVLPIPPSIDNIKSVKTLVDTFKIRKSMVNLDRPIMGTIPQGINNKTREKLIDFYIENDINLFGVDTNGSRPRGYILNLIKRRILENPKIKGNNYFMYLFNLPKAQYMQRDARPIHDILTVMYGVDGFNNQRFVHGGSKWSDLSTTKQQQKIDNVRFRILDDYGEYNRSGLSRADFEFTKNNETTILTKDNYHSIYEVDVTKKAYNQLAKNSKIHNWILTHKEINSSVRKEIENHTLLKYFKDKDLVKNEVESILSENPSLDNYAKSGEKVTV
jgi:hypothetical protein